MDNRELRSVSLRSIALEQNRITNAQKNSRNNARRLTVVLEDHDFNNGLGALIFDFEFAF
jgi:hypothetical protein